MGPRAELRVLRLAAGAGALVCVVVILARRTVVPVPPTLPEWYRDLLASALLVPVAVALRAPWAGRRSLRRWCAAGVVAHLAAPLSLLVVNLAALLPRADRQLPWVLSMSSVAVGLAVAAGGRRLGVAVLIASTALIEAIRLLSGQVSGTTIANDLQGTITSTAMLLLIGSLLTTARGYDTAAAAAYQDAARQSAEAARRAVRRRTQALVHDEVLSTLLLAGRATTSPLRRVVATQAARCRQLIDGLGTARDEPVEPGRLAARLSAMATAAAPGTELRLPERWRSAALPGEVATALTEAARQALVNSVQHAGGDARRTITVACDRDSLTVLIQDDGRGFDPRDVARDRMGLAVSIVGRMATVPGGSADVDAQPGRGVTVRLHWQRPTEDGPAAADDSLLPTRQLGRGVPLLLAAFLLADVVLAVLAARDGAGWTSYAGLGGVAAALATLGWRRLDVPSPRRTAAVMALCIGTAALSWLLPDAADPLGYGVGWHLIGSGFVLAALAMRGRPGAALTAVAVATALGVLRLVLQEGGPGPAAVARPAIMVTLAAGFTVAILRIRAETQRLRQRGLVAARRRAWADARATELQEHTRFLATEVGDTLTRLAGGEELDERGRRECLALEGRLRDLYRGRRLVRRPLVEAATAARHRGVDVVFLDDAPNRQLPEETLDAIAHWMRERLDRIPSGHFTGRILPPGRGALASAATGEESTLFRG